MKVAEEDVKKRQPKYIRVLPFEAKVYGSRESPCVDFILKTQGKRWGRFDLLECNNPIMEITHEAVYLFHPHGSRVKGTYFTRIPLLDVFGIRDQELIAKMRLLALKAFRYHVQSIPSGLDTSFRVGFALGVHGHLKLKNI